MGGLLDRENFHCDHANETEDSNHITKCLWVGFFAGLGFFPRVVLRTHDAIEGVLQVA